MTEWLDRLPLISANMTILAFILVALPASLLFYIGNARSFEKEYPSLSNGEFNWLIWPAIAANYFFESLFGKRGTSFRDLYTWRSVGVTFLISFFANIVCILLIFSSVPDDLPSFDFQLIKIYVLSYLFFALFNFLGDLVSVSFTRHILSKIVMGKCNFVHYLSFDFLGILTGYLITLLPTIFIVLYCLNTGDDFNKWIHTGLLGNAIIPFFLFIFATTKMFFAFPFFAFVSVFSITIPTLLYLFLMVLCYFGYRVYLKTWKRKEENLIEQILKIIYFFGKFLLGLAVFIGALAIVYKI